MKRKQPLPKPRNTIAYAMRQACKPGVHGKSKKAERRADKVRLSKGLSNIW